MGLNHATSQASFLTMGAGGLSLYRCNGSDLHLVIRAREREKGGEGRGGVMRLISKVKHLIWH